MKIGPFRKPISVVFCFLFFLFSSAADVVASSDSEDVYWDIILKIENIDEALKVTDTLISMGTDLPEVSPSAMIRSMLQGTDWMDLRRSIVIAVQLKEPNPLAFALVPFKNPNETFQNMFGAVSRDTYYILPIPPGQPMDISREAETALCSISEKKLEKSVSLEIFVNRLLKQNDEQIRKKLLDMQQDQNVVQGIGKPFTPEEFNKMVNDMVNVAVQMETFSIGMNLCPETIAASIEIQALEDTDLYKLFSPDTQKTLLNNYRPAKQMNYKTARFDIMGMLALMEQAFGALYKKSDFDFKKMTAIAMHFTGESAGGMDYRSGGYRIESITILQNPQKSMNFFETIFFPWLDDYNNIIQKFLGTNQGPKTPSIYRRTQDSKVSGLHVVGVNINIPVEPPETEAFEKSSSKPDMISYEFRMTVLDHLLLIAPDDIRLKELINIGKQLTPESLQGPMAWFNIDLASYFKSLKNIIPELSGPDPMPDMGKIGYDIDMKKGRLTVDSIIKLQEIQNVIQYINSLSVNRIETSGSPKTSDGN